MNSTQLIAVTSRALHTLARLLCVSTVLAVSGCAIVKPVGVPGLLEPSNVRNWEPNLAILPFANLRGNKCKVHNIRNCSYSTEDDYVVHHYDKEFDLDDLQTVDFIVVPFQNAPNLAHTMLSFGFGEGEYLCVSVEARLEDGEKYTPLLGMMRRYELMYVVADERDLIRLRTRHRNADVYIYRTKADRERLKALFADVMERVNRLAVSPEFYDTLANNCTTNIVSHINKIRPNRVPYALPVLLPGLSDRYAYDLGLIDTTLSFDEAKQRAYVNHLAERHYHAPDFSERIRR